MGANVVDQQGFGVREPMAAVDESTAPVDKSTVEQWPAGTMPRCLLIDKAWPTAVMVPRSPSPKVCRQASVGAGCVVRT